ncbi:MAG: hypothetical protein ABSD02_11710 [Steroidobacteraceae bacterium]|jgi:hypothetical protein
MSIRRLTGSLAAVMVLGIHGGDLRAQGPAPPVLPISAGNTAAQLYNSANAYARSGNAPLAVLDYERARVLDPTDADLRWNLHRVRESAGLPESSGWLGENGRFADPNTLYWVGITGLALGGGCVLALRFSPRFRGLLLAGTVLGIAAVGASAFNAAATSAVLSESIALRAAPASVSPVAGADALFQVPAAAAVRVLERHAGFELIRDSQGREGWVAATELAAVIPGPNDPR